MAALHRRMVAAGLAREHMPVLRAALDTARLPQREPMGLAAPAVALVLALALVLAQEQNPILRPSCQVLCR